MSDRFQPLSMEQLTAWVYTELDRKDSLFNVPRSAFFVPRPDHRFRVRRREVVLDTPFGVAAGPHTQLAQNIIAAWLVGARTIELKTIQTLDELEVHKPCIDVQDEGYNVEWSQELRVHQSFDEYLRAWILIHALHRRFGWPGERPGLAFDMSVGYNLAGILQPNVQWFLDAMADASRHLPAYVEIVARHDPAVRDLDIPARLSDSVTLSTMHGCPPDEIERISAYLIEERGLHTSVKCNPTLLGAERVRGIVNGDLGFVDVPVPDAAFGHDLRYEDAVPMVRRLRAVAAGCGLDFGLKLANTLEVDNWRAVFDRDATMYLSGRPLHAVTVNLAATLADEFSGEMPISFAGGADCFNTPSLIAGGLRTVTVTSDLLKTGGYLRLLQYPEQLDAAFDGVGATDIDDFIGRTARRDGVPGPGSTADAARFNLRRYAAAARRDWRYRKESFRTDRSKTARELHAFDCIQAPCLDRCPIDQQVPRYMDAVRRGDVDEAVRIVRRDNPLAAVLGRVCDHLCEDTCVRTHLDQPLAIRQIKRFIMDRAEGPETTGPDPDRMPRVAIIGAGPAGLAAAHELARAGIRATIFEALPYPGGMVGGAIPAYRLPQAQLDQDLAELLRLGVEVRFGVRAGVHVTLDQLREQGFAATFVAVGAQLARRLDLPGEDSDGVLDGVTFLRGVREGRPPAVGPRVAVIGAGDTAMDCARTARRLGAPHVSVIYRRTVDQMPADREEIHALREEGIEIMELARPVALRVEEGRLAGVTCVRTEYLGARDAAGRRVPSDVAGSEVEVGLDTLIVAISQHAVLDFLGGRAPELTADGYVAVDPATMATSIPGLYAGGDVAAHGPASIVLAAADGRRAAAAIAAVVGGSGAGDSERQAADLAAAALTPPAFQEMVLRRGRRAYRVPIAATPLERRAGFDETVLGYTPEEAVAEAGRCLDCDRMCSLCVGVCPNMALLTYEVEPVHAELPVLTVANGAIVRGAPARFVIEQRLQVAVLADLCNECGNCVTACPTSGQPYRDKPRLYLDRAEFEAQASNAFFRMLDGGAMEGRFEGRTHRIEVDGQVEYTAPTFRATLDASTLDLIEATATGAAEGDALSLEPAAVMVTLLRGVRGSMPHLPVAVEGGTRLRPPGTPEAYPRDRFRRPITRPTWRGPRIASGPVPRRSPE